ncbi:MAG: hypothetical protein KC457_00885 [Myxococcales bacterium]|nr:hypothetical protein [Myxococcales bacterium]
MVRPANKRKTVKRHANTSVTLRRPGPTIIDANKRQQPGPVVEIPIRAMVVPVRRGTARDEQRGTKRTADLELYTITEVKVATEAPAPARGDAFDYAGDSYVVQSVDRYAGGTGTDAEAYWIVRASRVVTSP